MVFKLSLSSATPNTGSNVQRGFPAPGAGSQTTGAYTPPPASVSAYAPLRPTKGRRSWFRPSSPQGGQRGFPAPLNVAQSRPVGSMPNVPDASGLPEFVETPYFSRGTAAFVPNYGKVLTNPIGAGVVAMHRPQASYGPAATYADGAIWWTSQAVPTTVNLQGLTDPAALAALLGPIKVQGVVRTTG